MADTRGRGSSRGGRGRGGSSHQSGGHDQQKEKPKKENILDLKKYVDKRISVKFNGGRESTSPPRSPIGSG
jgi:U6 snRNA-associated Sm-like protein LSm7